MTNLGAQFRTILRILKIVGSWGSIWSSGAPLLRLRVLFLTLRGFLFGYRQAETQTDRQIDRDRAETETDKQTGKQRSRQADRLGGLDAWLPGC